MLDRVFAFVLSKRWWVLAIYALLLPPSVFFALKVYQDNSLDRLIVQSDPDYINTHAFEQVFGAGAYVVVLAEADDPFAPAVLARLNALEDELGRIEQVDANSLIKTFRRSRGTFTGSAEEAAAFKKFALGTPMFRKQGLVGDRHLSIPLILGASGVKEREALLERIDAVLRPVEESPAPLLALRKVGAPYVDAMLDNLTKTSAVRYFALFIVFVVAVNLFLYRSWRTLLAFMIALAMSAAMTVGWVGLTGGVFTIVSALVPMTVMITCMATLVYIHGRFVDYDGSRPLAEHHVFALSNKFLACTASVFATAVGFAALAVSNIRPIREMGIWVSIGLVFTWLIVFTLFPVLQQVLKTPTLLGTRRAESAAFHRLTEALPVWSYRYRWVLVPSALLLSAVGLVAVTGVPGLLEPMRLQTEALDYIPKNSALYRDTRRLEETVSGLAVTEVWLKGKPGTVSDAEVIRGLDQFQRAVEADSRVGSAVGLTVILRTLRYLAGQGDQLPSDEAGLEETVSMFENLLGKERMLGRFVDPTLGQTHLTVIHRTGDYQAFLALSELIRAKWAEAVAANPALKGYEVTIAGLAPLQAKIAHHLVPTLTESFGLTVVIILVTFVLVFRSGAARIMAMIPSLFAILVMFLFMRLTGISLNVATILIASTVLGTSENDQIHFFYHFQEGRRTGHTEEALAHTLKVAGRAILFATLINAGGFCAFALAELPSMREFGILSALAFLLSALADFTALPAALWLVFREKPASLGGSAEIAPLRGPLGKGRPPEAE